jgi:outer membrane protein TolC
MAMAALEAARATFLTGQVDFSTVIEDFNLWLEAEVGFAQRQAQAFAAWARISLLLGDSGGES